MTKAAAVIAVLAALAGSPALAGNMGFKQPSSVAAPNPWYVFIDGMYESVPLPAYAIGIHNATIVDTDAGPASRFNVRVNGTGVRGGVGYLVPGTQWRLETSATLVAANGSQNQVAASGVVAGPVLLNGAQVINFACPCTTASQLNTRYESWLVSGKAAYDLRWGSAIISPFAALFGGSSRNDQTLSQAFQQNGGLLFTATYAATTALEWTDFGGRVGFDATVPVVNGVSLNLTGWLGIADRAVSLSGSDFFNSGLGNGNSTIATSATTTSTVANAEAGFSFTPMPTVTLRAFGGVNYDSRVPGISAPGYTGMAFISATPIPAALIYASETSYYAGAGAVFRY